ncbi:MAG: caspase family protein, partial [Candidatus Thiodiazotropha taylori]
VDNDQTPVKMVAVDKKGQRTSLEFLLIPKMRNVRQPQLISEKAVDPVADTKRLIGEVDFGEYHALVIGNNQYSSFPDLVSASTDAQQTAELLRDKYGFKTTVLMDATRYDMLSALNKLREELTDKDNLLIYYAGHGELDRVNLRGYWLPVDAEPNSTANWISNIAITDILNAMSAKHILVVADSCYSGSLTRSSMARLDVGMSYEIKTKWLKVMAKTRSRTVLTSGGLKPVLDQGGGKHSVFAKSFLKTLSENNSVLEAYTLFRGLAKEVQQTASKFGIDQIPEYAPIKHGGHEAGEFFFIPQG